MNQPIQVDCDIRDGVAMVTFTDPATRNALTDTPMIEAMLDCCTRIAASPDVRAAILRGGGGNFSSGGNIKAMRGRSGMFAGDETQIRESYRAGIQRLSRAVFDLPMPTIAAVEGSAFGAGLDLALACDIRIAADNVKLAENYVRLGLVSGFGGSWLLPRIVGYANAAELSFTGAPVDAAAALAMGLVSRVVPVTELLPTVQALAGTIAQNPRDALRKVKQLLRFGLNREFPAMLDLASEIQAACHVSPAHEERLAALIDRADKPR